MIVRLHKENICLCENKTIVENIQLHFRSFIVLCLLMDLVNTGYRAISSRVEFIRRKP